MIQRHKTHTLLKPARKTSRRVSPPVVTWPPSRVSPDKLYELGRSLRKKCPRQSHAIWKEPSHRADPVSLLKQSSEGRIPQLIPIRYGRMLQSPFAFYRGAALNMAADLAATPVTGLRVQACGDCHLLNFGMFATPERREIFDINDLDETLPAPWEWDVKRLAVSFVLACRNNGFDESSARNAALACARSYRRHMAQFSQMRVLDVWYASLDVDDLMAKITDKQIRGSIEKRLTSARHQSVLEHDFPKLAEVIGRMPVIKDNPPLIYHWRGERHTEFIEYAREAFARYRRTLPEDRRMLLDRYQVEDFAIKVVGVGSVGTWCGILLLMAAAYDPLFLQVKQARSSVLEAFAGKSVYPNHGQRVVHGCHLMQSASDLFLGWTEGLHGRHFYIRQLRDVKIKMLVETFNRSTMLQYAKLCSGALARAHARSGEPAKVSGYLGKSDKFDEAIADFATAYADQTERDYKVLKKAVRNGKLKVLSE